MPFPLRRTLDPLVEPVSLAAMKNYLRVDIDDDDDFISTLISVARERAEDMTGRCLLAQEWTFSMDRFPCYWGEGRGEGFFGQHHEFHQSLFRRNDLAITLPRGPVISVESIQYVDNTQTLQTLNPESYEVDYLSQPARITPVYAGSWPTALWDTNSVTIMFTAGYQQTVTEILNLVPVYAVGTTPPVTAYSATLQRASTAIALVSCSDLTLGAATNPVSVVPVAGVTFSNGVLVLPSTVNPDDVIQAVYTVTSIPQSFLHAIKLICSTYYENRAEVIQGGGNFNSFPLPFGAASLLKTYELFPLGYPKG